MNQAEEKLMQEQFKGVIAMIVSSNDIQAERDKNQQKQLDRIEAQTIKTNGRVFLLEKFQWTLTGKIIGISSVIGILFGVITFIFS